MGDVSKVVERVKRVYPQCLQRRVAFRIAMCALAREHRENLLMCQVRRRSCIEMTNILKTSLDKAAMSIDELCTLLVEIGRVHPLLGDNPFVSEMLLGIEKALDITLQSETSRQVWGSWSVKLLVCFASLLELTGPVLTKLFGQVGRSDMRRLESLQEAWYSKRSCSDAHLSALNHIVNTFALLV